MGNDCIEDRVGELLGFLQRGEIVEGMRRFYADDVSMRENRNEPTIGLDANIARETKFQRRIKLWHGVDVQALAVNGEHAFLEYTMSFTDQQDRRKSLEQVAVQRWENGRIASERFYYDPGGT